jgi:hypothetical protein
MRTAQSTGALVHRLQLDNINDITDMLRLGI